MGQVKLSDLDGEDLLLLDQPLSAQYVEGLLRASSAAPRIAARVRSLELLRSLVANQFGVAITHTQPPFSQSYDGKHVVSVPLWDELVEQRVLVACRRDSEDRPLSKAIIAEMISEFADVSRQGEPQSFPAC